MTRKQCVFILLVSSTLFLSCASKKHITSLNSSLIDVYAYNTEDFFIPPPYNGVKEIYSYMIDHYDNPRYDNPEIDLASLTPVDSLFFDKGGRLLKHVSYNNEAHGDPRATFLYLYDSRNRIKEVILTYENKNVLFCEYSYKNGLIEKLKIDGEREVRKYKNKRLAEREIYNADSLTRSYKYVYNNKGYLTELHDNRWRDSLYMKDVFTYERSDNILIVRGEYFSLNSDGKYEKVKSVLPSGIYLYCYKNKVVDCNNRGMESHYEYDERGNCVRIRRESYSIYEKITYYP